MPSRVSRNRRRGPCARDLPPVDLVCRELAGLPGAPGQFVVVLCHLFGVDAHIVGVDVHTAAYSCGLPVVAAGFGQAAQIEKGVRPWDLELHV